MDLDCSLSLGSFLPPLPPSSSSSSSITTSSEPIPSWAGSEDNQARLMTNNWEIVSVPDDFHDNSESVEAVSGMLPPTSIPTELSFQPGNHLT